MIEPGDLRHRIQLVTSSVTSPDGLGGGTRTTSTVATVWAAARQFKVLGEEVIGGGLRLRGIYRFTIRYPDSFTVTGDMRVVWQGRTFVIKSITQDRLMTRVLYLDCQEGE